MKNRLPFLILLILVFIIFSPWINLSKTLSSGDWPYLYKENIQEFKIPTESPFLWLEPYHQITAKIGMELFSFPWEISERLFWFLPFIFISVFSSYRFTKHYLSLVISGKNINLYLVLGVMIYIFNTYILMLVGGGQMGIVMAYSIAPLIFYKLDILIAEKFILRKLIMPTLALAIQLMFDPRLFILTIAAFLFYLIFKISLDIKSFKNIKSIFFCIIFSIIFNSFWIFGNIGYYQNTYSLILREPLAKFLSFATLANTISLLHPNWPENIFGKIDFMRPEFLLIPIIVFPP